MSESKDYIALVRQAQEGRAEARGELLRLVEPRLAQYVGRLTLDQDLTTDIVQESIAEMLKILDTLKDPDRFWHWLYTITLNKLRLHYRQRWRRRGKSLAQVQEDWLQARNEDVLAQVVTEELKEIVVRVVGQLEPRQRAVLTMRCYEGMSFQEIGTTLGCTQLGARALFFRGKKALMRLLRANGIDKGALPVALLIFGKFTATSEAAVAKVTISAATLRVGFWGTLVGMATLPTMVSILALVAAGGTYVVESGLRSDGAQPAAVVAEAAPAEAVSQEGTCWYYYPPGRTDTVMIRSTDQGLAYSQWLQNEQANYYRRGGTIVIRNHRQFAPDLSVWRLPTDSAALRVFLQTQDGQDLGLEPVVADARGLLVAVAHAQMGRRRQAHLNYDVSTEDYFRHDWSLEASLVDRRDDRHRAGWTRFTISGHLGSRPVSGYGILPFVAAAVGRHGPALCLTVGQDLVLLDSGAAAQIRDRSDAVLAGGAGGSLFEGLGRPWCGLHTIDTIRRDAAEAGIAFTTRLLPDGQRAEIVLSSPQIRLTYCVHLYQDWIETIAFEQKGVTIGEWTFNYPQPDEPDPHRLTVPSLSYRRGSRLGPQNDLWLMRLAEGNLVP